MSDRSRDAKLRATARHGASLILLPVVAIIVIPAPAAAYIDPVSGSVLLQIISAAVLAGAVTIGRFRGWLGGLFRRGGRRSPTDGE